MNLNRKEQFALIDQFEKEYGQLSKAYRQKLIGILNRPEPKSRISGLDVLALKAFPGGAKQRMVQTMRELDRRLLSK